MWIKSLKKKKKQQLFNFLWIKSLKKKQQLFLTNPNSSNHQSNDCLFYGKWNPRGKSMFSDKDSGFTFQQKIPNFFLCTKRLLQETAIWAILLQRSPLDEGWVTYTCPSLVTSMIYEGLDKSLSLTPQIFCE